jgi:hypothetical protein
MRLPRHRFPILFLTTVTTVTVALAASRPPRGTQGAYDIRIGGYVRGTGNAAVGATSVTITARVRDEDGNTGTLVAPALPITDGRFIGTGMLMGKTLRLSGRIDAPDGELVPIARITGTFTVSDGHHGRVIGSRKGP